MPNGDQISTCSMRLRLSRSFGALQIQDFGSTFVENFLIFGKDVANVDECRKSLAIIHIPLRSL
jgi:hypothetical protein